MTAKERILLYGGAGTGKSSAAFQIARFYQQTGTEGTIHIADTDSAAERMKEGGYKDLDNVIIYPCYDWEDLLQFTTMPFGVRDWLVVDFISSAWQMVQNYYAEEVFGHDMANQIMYTRARIEEINKSSSKEKAPQALDPWKDWPSINGRYLGWLSSLYARNRVHLLATATPKDLTDQTPSAVAALTRSVGVMPAGQKELVFQFHTVLYMQKMSGKYLYTSIKDRERLEVYGHENVRFPISYLAEIAGWQVDGD